MINLPELTEPEVAELLGVTSRSLRNYRTDGRLKCYEIGGRIRYRSEDVQAFIDSCERKVGAEESK